MQDDIPLIELKLIKNGINTENFCYTEVKNQGIITQSELNQYLFYKWLSSKPFNLIERCINLVILDIKNNI